MRKSVWALTRKSEISSLGSLKKCNLTKYFQHFEHGAQNGPNLNKVKLFFAVEIFPALLNSSIIDTHTGSDSGHKTERL